MASFASSGSLSPDPLAESQNGSTPSKPNQRRPTTPRKTLGSTTGNRQSPGIGFIAPFLPKKRDLPRSEDAENEQNGSSPWRVRVTVQAQPEHPRAHHAVPQCSPSKIFAERTYTTTVPLKGGDDSSPVPPKFSATPKKPWNTPKKMQPIPKPSTHSQSKVVDSFSVNDISQSSKRGRGRPRKSTEITGGTPSIGQLESGPSSQQGTSPPNKTRDETSNAFVQKQLGVCGDREEEIMETMKQTPFLDSIMESEGFSMVSVSSLPSNQSPSGLRIEPHASSKGAISPESTRRVTPSPTDGSPKMPPPPKPAAALQSTRELNEARDGASNLANVIRAGMALQNVLFSADQPRVSIIREELSSLLAPGASSEERMNKGLFCGWGPATQRELRAGLRFGEELAKRQGLNISSEPGYELSSEDVFAPNPEIGYPQLPSAAAGLNYSLKVPGSSVTKSPSIVNPQLPSPADSEADTEDDRMSWKYDTLPRGAASPSPMQLSYPAAGSSAINSPLANKTTMDSIAMWHQEQEQRCQRERQAVSKQIQEANSSQVIVVNSDDETNSVHRATDEEDGDIWQEQAQSSGTGQSTSDIPPIFRQTEPRKPRRSLLPSPWMRKTQDVLNSSIAPNDADLFWQPSQAQEASSTSTSHAQDKGTESEPGDLRSSSILETPSQIESPIISINTESSFQDSHAAEASLHQSEGSSSEIPKATILNQTFHDSDADDTTYQDDEDVDSLDSEDEDMASRFLDSLSMQDETTSLLGESTQIGLHDSDTMITSTPVTHREEGSSMQTPLPPSSVSKLKTPKSKTPKHVRFSTELSRSHAGGKSLAKADEPQPAAPLPPAPPASWLSRLTSYLPAWSLISAAAVPLPSAAPKKRIVRITQLDQGPLPLYMPWTPRHWWAFINIWRLPHSDPASAYPFPDKNRNVAAYLNDIVTVNGWSKRITKEDCGVVAKCIEVFGEKGTYRGVEEMLVKGVKEGGLKKKWGKRDGELINVDVLFKALVVQWACMVMEGECKLGWNDRAGWKGKGEGEGKEGRWSKKDLGGEKRRGVVYV
ncbi:MAG: hypothetical protein LQ350_006711 [Teloschistes chrysophthalmus]|nr:MAG: hypothetical protein LQ350_006711 [Niorma chrysophthalma]